MVKSIIIHTKYHFFEYEVVPVSKAKKRKIRRNITVGVAHINATFNNTTVTITDNKGDALCWASAGHAASKEVAKAHRLPDNAPLSKPLKRPRSSVYANSMSA